jgi:hypothetical protein
MLLVEVQIQPLDISSSLALYEHSGNVANLVFPF